MIILVLFCFGTEVSDYILPLWAVGLPGTLSSGGALSQVIRPLNMKLTFVST
jgi:hypothetical protein